MKGYPSIAMFLLAGMIIASGGVLCASEAAKYDASKIDMGFGIDEKLGDSVALDEMFVDESGSPIKLSSLIDGTRTTLLTLNYSNCPGLCIAQLDGLTDSLKKFSAMKLGEQFQVITISIDPKELPERAAATKARYVHSLGLDPKTPAWRFLTGQESAIKSVAASVGFRYSFDPKTQRYNHSAATIVISPTGKVTRYLYAPAIDETTMRLALVEGSQGKLGTSLDAIALWCMEYNPEANRYSAIAYRLLSFVFGGFILLLFGLCIPFWFSSRRTTEELPEVEQSNSEDHSEVSGTDYGVASR